MKGTQRKIKKYKPRRRRSNKELQKQHLKDFELLLEMDLFSYLTLSETATSKQTEQARMKIERNLTNYGYELETIGRDLGSGFPELIHNYVQSLKEIIKSSSNKVDSDLILLHRKQAALLKKNAI